MAVLYHICVRVGVRVKVGFKDSVGVQNGQNLPMERRAPLAPMDSYEQHLWQLTVGWRPPRGGGGDWRPRTHGVGPPVAALFVLHSSV